MSEQWSELLMNDHQTTEKVFEAVERALAGPGNPPPGLLRDAAQYFKEYVDGCHNRKEEEHLFPLVEQRGIPRHGGPLAVMLMEHEQNRQILPVLVDLVDEYIAGDATVLGKLRETFAAYASLMKNHFWKENDILYPMARRVMSGADAQAVVAGIEAVEESVGPYTRQKYYGLAERITTAGGVEDLSFGVEREVMAAILNTLPIELSFVDKDDRVRYFSPRERREDLPPDARRHRHRGAELPPAEERPPGEPDPGRLQGRDAQGRRVLDRDGRPVRPHPLLPGPQPAGRVPRHAGNGAGRGANPRAHRRTEAAGREE